MSLRLQAERDLALMIEAENDFGWLITITDPAGFTNSEPLYALSGDIGQTIDPNTGMPVAGRSAYTSIRISSLRDEGFATLPANISDNTLKPWLITFLDIEGNSFTYKVIDSMPDRALGQITCELQLYDSIPD